MALTKSIAEEVAELPGIKEDELVAYGPCAICGKKLLETGELTFYCVEVRHAALDACGIQRRAGAEMMMQSALLARVFGPNDDLAKVVSHGRAVIHESCAPGLRHPMQVVEAGAGRGS